MAYSVGLVCSVGVGPARGGRDTNEDNYVIGHEGRLCWREGADERASAVDGAGLLAAVCDGMGGHRDGEIAATTAARVMAKLYRPGLPRDPSGALRRYVMTSHRTLHERARTHGPVKMGTTLTAVWLFERFAAWAQVGDSRLYHLHDGQLLRVTRDQTRNEFARRDSRAAVAEGHRLAQNFIYGSRGLGDDAALRLEVGKDSGIFMVEPGDRLLLCTDGLSGVVDDTSIGEVLRHTPDPQAAALACMDRAIARGSTDNVTALVIRVDAISPAPEHVWDDEDSTATF